MLVRVRHHLWNKLGCSQGFQMSHPNTLPPFAALRAFESVFRTGGIRKAASDLCLNHAVVSRHIRHLEDWLGITLFHNVGNKLHLTDAGAAYHARISVALMELSIATSEIRGEIDDRPLIITCVPGFCVQWVSVQLAELEHVHPDIIVEVRPTDVPPNLLTYESDLDIRYQLDCDLSTKQIRGLRSSQLARPDVIPVASPKVAERVNREGTLAGLVDGPLLHENSHTLWRAWLKLNGLEMTELPGRLHWHAHLAIAAARQGRGVMLGNRYLLEGDLSSGALVEIKIPGTKPHPIGSYMFFSREDGWSKRPLTLVRNFLRSRAS